MITAYCDMRVMPITFDCITFYAAACQAANILKEDISLELININKFRKRTDKDLLHEDTSKQWRFSHITLATALCVKQFKKVNVSTIKPENIATSKWFPKYSWDNPITSYNPALNINLFRQGASPKIMSASDAAIEKVRKRYVPKKYITITIRQSEYQPKRNSDITTLIALKNELENSGISAIFIPDTEYLLANGNTFGQNLNTDIIASIDYEYRLGLYSQSLTNISTCGGPAHGLWYSDYNFISFLEDHPEYPQSSKETIHRTLGVRDGEQYPWFSEKQEFSFSHENLNKIYDHISKCKTN